MEARKRRRYQKKMKLSIPTRQHHPSEKTEFACIIPVKTRRTELRRTFL
jgi:hypothetical protein